MERLTIPSPASLDDKALWQVLTLAHRYLAELKGLCEALPNPAILLETLSIQEAKDSSEIENIITTHDALYTYTQHDALPPAIKEVQHYVDGLHIGYHAVRTTKLIRMQTILDIQASIMQSQAGFRTLPDTILKNQSTGNVVYEPPQDGRLVAKLKEK